MHPANTVPVLLPAAGPCRLDQDIVPLVPCEQERLRRTSLDQCWPSEADVDLSFDTHLPPYATHALHPFPAKFPPALARWGIERFSAPGDWLLDPFAGSGTTLVEARLLGRNALAAEIDPLARLLTRVKATPLDPMAVEAAKWEIDRRWADQAAGDAAGGTLDDIVLPEFPSRDYWFAPSVQHALARLVALIGATPDRRVREFLLAVYSSVIITKGPSTVANAVDIAHSRARHVERRHPPDVWTRFNDRYRRAVGGLRELHRRADRSVHTLMLGHDARALPLRSRTVDAILTSPPYVTAIEYPRGHKFSVWWIGPHIGVPHRVYERLRDEFIGTENVRRQERARLRAEGAFPSALASALRTLDETDDVRAGRTRRYFHDMRLALAEMLRVLKPGRCAVLVVADSNLRGVRVPTGACLIEIAESLAVDGAGFCHRDTLGRTIRERNRQLPVTRGRNGAGMNREAVLILQRVPARRTFPVRVVDGCGGEDAGRTVIAGGTA